MSATADQSIYPLQTSAGLGAEVNKFLFRGCARHGAPAGSPLSRLTSDQRVA